MCLYPRLIKNPKYKATKKNGGNVPPILDDRVKYVPVGCTQCIECRKQKARNWQVRLLEDLKTNHNGKFIALTLSNQSYASLYKEIDGLEGYEIDNQIATLAVRRFLERWRKKYKRSLRHWLVTELGHKGTENIHLHSIIWTNEPLQQVTDIWQYGFTWTGYMKNGKLQNYVNEQTVNYIIKYVHKIDQQHKTYKSKVLTSPGIGGNYTNTEDSNRNKYNSNTTNTTYRTRTGHSIALPTYWRNKIYSETEREKLWIEMLNKQERWICGERVDISKGYNNYDKLLAWHRKINKQLGYGTDEKDWSRFHYERERRKLIQQARIQNGFAERF